MKGGGPIVRSRANLRGDSDGGPSIHERGIRLHVFYDALRYWRIRGLFVAAGPEIEILREGMQRLGKMPNCCSPTDATSGFVMSAVANIKIMHENRRRNDGAKKNPERLRMHFSATFHVIAVAPQCNLSSADVYHVFITIYLFSLREENCV